MVVTYGASDFPTLPSAAPLPFVPLPPPRLSPLAWALVGIVAVGLGLLAWLMARWRRVALNARDAAPAPACLNPLPAEWSGPRVRLRLTEREQSPAVCGLFRPVILLPRSLAERLSPAQLRAVLLHELVHLRRGDVWVNCAQALLQVLYWWHPLLWLANARIRRVREEAVDDAVMLALRDDAESYAPTLLAVAKLALPRPLATLGLVGILESRGSLRQRIERLIDFRPPRKAGLTLGSALAVLGFAALAVPMGEAPAPSEAAQSATSPSTPINAEPDIVSDYYPEQGELKAWGLTNKSASDVVSLYGLIPPVHFTRTFKIDPDILIEKLRLAKGAIETNDAPISTRAVLAFFARAGVDLDPTRAPGKGWLYHSGQTPSRGMLVVRGSAEDLEAIERQIAALKEPAGQPPAPAEGPQESGKGAATNTPAPPVFTNDSLLAQKINATKLVRDGKLLYEMGDLNWAEAELKLALNADPHNEAALYYLNLVSEAKFSRAPNSNQTPVEVAVNQAVYREANRITLRQRLTDARAAQDDHSLASAAKLYDEVWELVLKLGASVDAERDQTITGLTAVRMELARAAQARGNYQEARTQVDDVLRVDPTSAAAIEFKSKNEKLLADQRSDDIRSVERAWATPTSREVSPVPNPNTRTNRVFTGQGRQSIISKLDRIRLESVSFDGLPLSQVLRTLSEETTKRDPEKRGINFVVAQNATSDDNGTASFVPALGTNRQPDPAPAPALPEVADTKIKLSVPLTDLRLADVLDVIVKVADRPIKYSIEDYAVVFSARGLETTPLYMRTFKVDPNTLLESLHVAKGPGATDGSAAIVSAVRDYLAKLGVDLDPVRYPGKAIFFNDRQGLLVVRTTLQDLDIIEVALQLLSSPPPQININAKFIEIPHKDDNALGFDWYLGNVLMTGGSTNGRIGVAAPTNSPSASPKPGVFFPGGPPAGSNELSSAIRRDPFSVGSLSPGLTGILTEPQCEAVLKALQRREGVRIVAEPQATVLSGRQLQCKTTDIQTVVKGIDARALTPPGITSTNDTEGAGFATERMEFGPILDVIPRVLPDGYTINLSLAASLLEFLGYEDYPTNRVTVYVNGKPKQVSPPRPIVHTAKISSQVDIRDGQTLVLSGLVSEQLVTMKDDIPVLGDLPLVGRLFRSESKGTQRHKLLVFITPTIIDPAGNRVHSDDEMPSGSKAIPPQPRR